MFWILPLILSFSRLFPGLWELFQGFQLLLVSLSPSCFTVFSALWQDPSFVNSITIFDFQTLVHWNSNIH